MQNPKPGKEALKPTHCLKEVGAGHEFAAILATWGFECYRVYGLRRRSAGLNCFGVLGCSGLKDVGKCGAARDCTSCWFASSSEVHVGGTAFGAM